MAEATDEKAGAQIAAEGKVEPPPSEPSSLPSTRLVAEAAREAVTLVKAQVELAKTELKEDVRAQGAAAKGLSLALVATLSALNLLLVAAAVGLAQVLPLWAALLALAAAMLLVAGVAGALGWKRVRSPLQKTRQSLEEDVKWVKERIA